VSAAALGLRVPRSVVVECIRALAGRAAQTVSDGVHGEHQDDGDENENDGSTHGCLLALGFSMSNVGVGAEGGVKTIC
jgi:hypothetical protein